MGLGAHAEVEITGKHVKRLQGFKAHAITNSASCALPDQLVNAMTGTHPYTIDTMVVVYSYTDPSTNATTYDVTPGVTISSGDWAQTAASTDTTSSKQQVIKDITNPVSETITIEAVYLLNSANNSITVDGSGNVTGSYLFYAVPSTQVQVSGNAVFRVTFSIWLSISTADGTLTGAGTWLSRLVALLQDTGNSLPATHATPNAFGVYDATDGLWYDSVNDSLKVSGSATASTGAAVYEIDYKPSADTSISTFKYYQWDDVNSQEIWSFTFSPSTAPSATGNVTNKYVAQITPSCG